MKKLHNHRRFWRYLYEAVKLSTTRPSTRGWAKRMMALWGLNCMIVAAITGFTIYVGEPSPFSWGFVITASIIDVTMLYWSICGWFWRKDQDEFEAVVSRAW